MANGSDMAARYQKVTEHPVRAFQSWLWQVSRLADIGARHLPCPGALPAFPNLAASGIGQTFPVTVAGAAAVFGF